MWVRSAWSGLRYSGNIQRHHEEVVEVEVARNGGNWSLVEGEGVCTSCGCSSSGYGKYG